MKQQKIHRKKPSKQPHVENRKAFNKITNPSASDRPVRAVLFVEVHDMDDRQVRMLIKQLNQAYQSAQGGIHYCIPVRNGKIPNDITFEEEFEKVSRKLLEVVDQNGNVIENAKIRLKGGAEKVEVIRQKV